MKVPFIQKAHNFHVNYNIIQNTMRTSQRMGPSDTAIVVEWK